jgi:hypothetical protein
MLTPSPLQTGVVVFSNSQPSAWEGSRTQFVGMVFVHFRLKSETERSCCEHLLHDDNIICYSALKKDSESTSSNMSDRPQASSSDCPVCFPFEW